MSALSLRRRVHGHLLDEVRDVQFPSVTMLNRVEAAIVTREQLEEYIEALVERVEGTHYPSVALLNRIDATLERLEELERIEQVSRPRESVSYR
jgi:hypothetical protein